MYPSGTWRGFWQQEGYGRQPMEEFQLQFDRGAVTGRGVDVVGLFLMRGEFNSKTGAVQIVKQYVGKHAVHYRGEPDGEGSILGTWKIDYLGMETRGPFLMQPVKSGSVGDLPIRDIAKPSTS